MAGAALAAPAWFTGGHPGQALAWMNPGRNLVATQFGHAAATSAILESFHPFGFQLFKLFRLLDC